MALALSLSLDLFLMKGSLLIAVNAQPETNEGGRRQNKPKRGGGKESRSRKRGQNTGVWLTWSQKENGRDAGSTDLLARRMKSTIHNTQTRVVNNSLLGQNGGLKP